MRRFITIAILLLPTLAACTEDFGTGSVGATSVVLSRDNVDLLVGETATLTATVLPESLGMGVEWSVLDEEYADVKDGVVTGKAEGVTYVIATSADGRQKTACMVSVNPPIKYAVSIKDASNQLLDGVYGYPGMSIALSAVTSDKGIHTFTWSIEDESVATVTSEGVVTLGKKASSDAAFIYDAQSFLKVVTEDGCGCKIPIRSSLLAGLQVGGVFNPAGTPIIVQAAGSYPVAVMYQGAYGRVAIPSDVVDIELNNSKDFTVQESEGGFTLTTGPSTGVSTSFSVSLNGSDENIAIAQLKIDKIYAITAQFAGASSSTLVFTWTEGVSEDDDIAKPYTIYLYKDEDCTELEVSFSIPAGNGCWKNSQPKFVLSGLEPSTQYWFKVVDTSSSEVEKDSPLIPAKTEAFTIVVPGSDPAGVGDIILAEDFSELCWGADEVNLAAGFDVADNSSSTFQNRNANSFVATTGQYAQRLITDQATARKKTSFRLYNWAGGYYAREYVGPGYIFLGTYSYGTHIITSKLNNIPEGKTAKVKVVIHAAGHQNGGKAVLAVQHGNTLNNIGSGKVTNKYDEGYPVDLESNVETISFNGGLTTLSEFTVTLDGLLTGDRIAFGPEAEKVKGNSNMMLLSDITVQIVELK